MNVQEFLYKVQYFQFTALSVILYLSNQLKGQNLLEVEKSEVS